ncbi:GerMN domain-containing protein [bacterium]|nr:GerMN domain-containing protein [bacterium]
MALLTAFLLVFKSRRAGRTIRQTAPDALVLSYPHRQGGWREVRRMRADYPGTLEEKTRWIVAELTRPDSDPAVFTPLPETFPLRSVFSDGSRLYLDISAAALGDLSGGSMEEIVLLESLKRSFAVNLPEIDQVQILVEGSPRRTLGGGGEDAGHINILDPLPLRPR